MTAQPTQHTIQYGTTTIQYELTFTDRTTLAIHVHPDTRVTVEAPTGSTLEQIAEKVHKRARWIVKQQRDFSRYSFSLPPRRYVSGESHLYLGKQYRLKVIQSATSREIVRMYRGRLTIFARDSQDLPRKQKLLEDWYRKQAKRVYQERLTAEYPRLERLGIAFPEITVHKMKSRWGSCTAQGKITLNLKLVQMPKDCIDYVIVHELCHLVEHNHSPAFYALLVRVMPDWERRRDKINQLAGQM